MQRVSRAERLRLAKPAPPKPVAVIAHGQSLHSRTVELCMVRIADRPRLEGASVALFSGLIEERGSVLRHGMAHVQAVRERDGRIEALFPANLSSLFVAAATGDGVYLAQDVEAFVNRAEVEYVEAWKAGRR